MNFCKKASLIFWTATNKKVMKIENSNICKTKFSVIKEMPMKLQNCDKEQSILIFAPYNFLISLDTQLHEAKISEKTLSEFFGNGV